MFSRYSGISIPKNYGGSRFATLSETETKTHRALTTPAPIKSSHSPSFIPINEQKNEEIADEVSDFEEFESVEELEDEQVDNADELSAVEDSESANSTEHSSILKSMLSDLGRDELIILGLILLLISDSPTENTDIVMILALLLVNGR